MPLNLQKNLPAIELLKKEHIFVMDSLRASSQDIRPLRVVVLNLMPLKITTETDLIRLLSNTPLHPCGCRPEPHRFGQESALWPL